MEKFLGSGYSRACCGATIAGPLQKSQFSFASNAKNISGVKLLPVRRVASYYGFVQV